MSTTREDWRQCYDWLARCGLLLPPGGSGGGAGATGGDPRARVALPVSPSSSPPAVDGSQLYDFAQMLLDGVLLCHLAIRLRPGAIDPKDFSLRPQMSQFLCLKNIRVFLLACKKVFGLKDSDIFDANDLFEVKDFGKVLHTLSVLSHTADALKLGVQSFSLSMGAARRGQYYNTLPTIASEKGGRHEPLYGVVDCEHDDDEDDVYGRLVDRPPKSKDSLPSSKREMCIKELAMTEKNYIDALQMMKEYFMKPLQEVMHPLDHSLIFLCIERFHTIHSGFYADLSVACGVGAMGGAGGGKDGGGSPLTIADCFVTWKEKFLLYGEFCSNLPHAQDLLDKLCANSTTISNCVTNCQLRANEGRFKLRDLLSVPMQRVLKYHLLLKELINQTERGHADKKSLERALDEMMDLSTYVNEVKRDNETLQLINEIENSITDLQMPVNISLKDYGRLLKDGELKIRVHSEQTTKTRYVFLFDKVLLMCKARGDQYSYKSAVVMGLYQVEDTTINVKGNFGFPFILAMKSQFDAITIGAKTLELRTKWIEAMRLALDNTSPQFARAGSHDFQMASFSEPTICDVCRKLLRGVFYQGYKCQKSGMVVHKECIERGSHMTGPPKPPPKTVPSRSSSSSSQAERPSKGRVRVICAYQGVPSPPSGRPLPLDSDSIVELLSGDDSSWWEGRLNGREGFFPKECARLITDNSGGVVHRGGMAHRGGVARRGGVAHKGGVAHGGGVCQRGVVPRGSHTTQRLNGLVVGGACLHGLALCEDLANQGWFVGGMSRDEAARKLERLPNGTFLIRVSQSDVHRGEYALSIKYGRDHPVKHIKLQRTTDGGYFLADIKVFHSILELIQYYQQNSLEVSFPEVPSVLLLPYKDAVAQQRGSEGGAGGGGGGQGGVLGYCYALYDYAAMEPNQISMKHGDRVAVLSKAGGQRGWWKGQNHGKVGYFPTTFVTESEDDDRLPPR